LAVVINFNQYWPDKPKNHTELNGRMMEQVVTVNSIYDYRTPFEVVIEKNFPGASFAVYNVNGLVSGVMPMIIVSETDQADAR
jgi:hypothetical protein